MLSLAVTFLPFAVAAAFTPGPNNVMLAASGANFGIRRSIPHISGIIAGFPVLLFAVGLGLGSVFERYPEIHTILKFVGSAFLLYLAWRIATAAPGPSSDARGRPLTFLEAALFQWVNPKAWVFSVTAIATYTTVGGGVVTEVAVLVVTCIFVSMGATMTWTAFGVGLNRFLKDSPRALRTFNIGMALLLVLSIVPILL